MAYKMPDNIVKVIQKMKRHTFNPPEKPDKSKCVDSAGNYNAHEYVMAKFMWKEDWKLVKTREQKYQESKANAWALVYNQFLSEMKVKLDGTSGYEKSKNDNDVIALLTMMQGYCCKFDALNNEYMGLVGAFKNLLYFFQKPMQSILDYHKDFLALIEIIEEYGGAGSLTHFPNMIKKELLSDNFDVAKATSDAMKKAKKKVREKFLAALMLDGANYDKYGNLKRSIQENYVTRTSEYPVSPEVVLRILNAYVPPPGWNRRMKQDGRGDSGGMFAQTDDDTWKKNITCHKCGKKGHLARECKSKKKPDQVHANVEEEDSDEDKDKNLFVQHKAKGVVNKNYLLLDNQSTIDQIANPDLLTNIRKSQKTIVVHCNTGEMKTDLEGKLGDMTVHHNPKSIANVLSLHSVKQKHQVSYDCWDRNGVFVVHMPKGVVEFKPSERGLHYIYVSKEGTWSVTCWST
jgi:hypothetical protein